VLNSVLNIFGKQKLAMPIFENIRPRENYPCKRRCTIKSEKLENNEHQRMQQVIGYLAVTAGWQIAVAAS
jgi:hypothetical protein